MNQPSEEKKYDYLGDNLCVRSSFLLRSLVWKYKCVTRLSIRVIIVDLVSSLENTREHAKNRTKLDMSYVQFCNVHTTNCHLAIRSLSPCIHPSTGMRTRYHFVRKSRYLHFGRDQNHRLLLRDKCCGKKDKEKY